MLQSKVIIHKDFIFQIALVHFLCKFRGVIYIAQDYETTPTLYSCTCPIATYILLDANSETLVVKSVQSEHPI
jgi:hypothetical protein